MSYELALHVLVTFTGQVVVPIHKHNTLFWILSISATKTVTLKLTKKGSCEVIWLHSHYVFMDYLNGLV